MDPAIWSDDCWRTFFAAMAVWNLAIALPGIVTPSRGFRLMYGVDTDRFYELYQHWTVSAVVLLFGVGYGIIAIEPSANLGLVLVGFLAKAFAASLITILFSRRRATRFAFVVAAVDAVSALVFLRYLTVSLFFVPSLGG
jgi:hypothetical protein